MTTVNRQFLLRSRPRGMVRASDLEYHEAPLPTPGQGEFLVRTRYISLDPSMRGHMENRSDYAAPLGIGDLMRARGVGEVVESNDAETPVGTAVFGFFGMQDYAVIKGRPPQFRLCPAGADLVAELGVLGSTGLTAYFGMLEVAEPRAGDVVVVSGAAGATGSVAGQIARIKGCRVIGIAGTAEKCGWLDELGFDAAIDYKTRDVAAELDRLVPDGLDVYFDNVGGELLDFCLARLRLHARVALCGGISRYNETGELSGPKNYFNLVFRRARMQGFLLGDFADRFDAALDQMRSWLASGELRHRATVIAGFEQLPSALVRLFHGDNVGKMMVRTD